MQEASGVIFMPEREVAMVLYSVLVCPSRLPSTSQDLKVSAPEIKRGGMDV